MSYEHSMYILHIPISGYVTVEFEKFYFTFISWESPFKKRETKSIGKRKLSVPLQFGDRIRTEGQILVLDKKKKKKKKGSSFLVLHCLGFLLPFPPRPNQGPNQVPKEKINE